MESLMKTLLLIVSHGRLLRRQPKMGVLERILTFLPPQKISRKKPQHITRVFIEA